MGNTVAHSFLRSRLPSKRKTSIRDYGREETDVEDEMFVPKRRKLMSTSKYIYKTLFEEGQGSDVKIIALNREWNLHRIYLSQSPYFNTMFHGLWVETTQSEINMGIEDENVTVQALHKVFGSLYKDEIQIDSFEAVSILACAILLQLDDLIHQSVEVMKDSINIDTALPYYEASELYGLKEVKSISLDWLHHNMVLKVNTSPVHLAQISCDLMAELISSPELVVVQTEFSLYLMLKVWLFLKEHPCESFDNAVSRADDFFKLRSGDVPFLLTNAGKNYHKAFRALRLKHLVAHHVDLEIIESDNIIPIDWFFPVFKTQWYHMLRIDQGADQGPRQATDEEFKRDCVRCGRILKTDTQHSWRWTGFSFGFDVVIYYSNGAFKLHRFFKTDGDLPIVFSAADVISLRAKKRNLMFRISVFSLDKNGRLLSKAETVIDSASLFKNEQVTVLNLPMEMKFPIVVSANFLLTTPLQSSDGIMPVVRNLEEYS
ncbi:protein germ cell-less-like [Uloborus diversus]|uniref:protein germ cell-less-like n=1 Tax=Uloborus diversus TaxID=327109 RepID=UPI0024092F43|nr:protein germ cell-less-like [Uloborus diversus]XP_054706476.1 protein germ cell-less-like [Uloborus diversus]